MEHIIKLSSLKTVLSPQSEFSKPVYVDHVLTHVNDPYMPGTMCTVVPPKISDTPIASS